MGLQKYRADKAGSKQKNGGTPYYTWWLGGPTLALVRDCKIADDRLTPRTVYVRDEADTYFSIPAACRYKGKTIKGYITGDMRGEFIFQPYDGQGV